MTLSIDVKVSCTNLNFQRVNLAFEEKNLTHVFELYNYSFEGSHTETA